MSVYLSVFSAFNFWHQSLRDDGGGAARESLIGGAAPVSQRLTAQRAAEPQEINSQFLHTFYITFDAR